MIDSLLLLPSQNSHHENKSMRDEELFIGQNAPSPIVSLLRARMNDEREKERTPTTCLAARIISNFENKAKATRNK